jgi:putative alpha-1,2-mannosidase
MVGIHDAPMLADVLGGKDAAIAKLEMMLELTKQDFTTADPSATNFPRPYYWAGNEPDITAPYLFAQLGRPDLTEKWVRWLADTFYSDQPEGVPGNDDGGTMGAWYVFAAVGLSPVPGRPLWIVGSPRFTHAHIIEGAQQLDIDVTGSGPYVKSVDLDGQPIGVEIGHEQLVGARTMHFVMSDTPTSWGR